MLLDFSFIGFFFFRHAIHLKFSQKVTIQQILPESIPNIKWLNLPSSTNFISTLFELKFDKVEFNWSSIFRIQVYQI